MAAPRITGKLAALFLSPDSSASPSDFSTAVKVADIIDWTLESTAETFECAVKNESYDRFESGGANARLTAQRYLLVGTTDALNARTLSAVRVTTTAGRRIAWQLSPISTVTEGQSIGTGSPSGARYAFGFGWVVRGSLTAPRGMMVDSFEIQIDGEWQYGTTS